MKSASYVGSTRLQSCVVHSAGKSKGVAYLSHKKIVGVNEVGVDIINILGRVQTDNSDILITIKGNYVMVMVEFPSHDDKGLKDFTRLLDSVGAIQYDHSRKLEVQIVDAAERKNSVIAKIENWAFDDWLPMITFTCRKSNTYGRTLNS